MNYIKLGIIILLGCQAIGYIIMPVLHNPFQYYITAYAFSFAWIYLLLSNNQRLR